MQTLKHIIVVEDDDGIRFVTELTLRDLGGFELTLCSSGKEALSKISDPSIQLVLLDVMMPEMDGLTVYKEIAKTRELPVVFMTAKAQKHEVEELMELGALGVIAKPFEPSLLSSQIKKLWAEYMSDK